MTYQLGYIGTNPNNGEDFLRAVLAKKTYETLRDAREARMISGDLVFEDGQLCRDPSWLWDWERSDPNSYAYRMMQLVGAL